MRSYHIAVDNTDQAELFKLPDGPPECGLATPGILSDLGLLGVDRAVVGPQPEESYNNLSLTSGQSQEVGKTVPDQGILLKEKPG